MKEINIAILAALTITLANTGNANAQFSLTEPNVSSGSGCDSSFSLTQANECSDDARVVRITNNTSATVYYDFGSNKDESLAPNETTTWTLNSNVAQGRVVYFDSNLVQPGIQGQRIQVYGRYNLQFLRSDDRTLGLYYNNN